MALLILTSGWTKCPKLVLSCSQRKFVWDLVAWVREETWGLCQLCHNLLCDCGTSAFWVLVSPPVQEGAKDPFISSLHLWQSLGRTTSFPTHNSKVIQRAAGRRREIYLPQGSASDHSTKEIPSKCSAFPRFSAAGKRILSCWIYSF